LGTDGTLPLSEKIIAATQSSHNAIENVSSVPRLKEKSKSPGMKAIHGAPGAFSYHLSSHRRINTLVDYVRIPLECQS
jgi:hypothetical protein